MHVLYMHVCIQKLLVATEKHKSAQSVFLWNHVMYMAPQSTQAMLCLTSCLLPLLRLSIKRLAAGLTDSLVLQLTWVPTALAIAASVAWFCKVCVQLAINCLVLSPLLHLMCL